MLIYQITIFKNKKNKKSNFLQKKEEVIILFMTAKRKENWYSLKKEFKKLKIKEIVVENNEFLIKLNENETLTILEAKKKLKEINDEKIAERRIKKRLKKNLRLLDLNVFQMKIVYMTTKNYKKSLKKYQSENFKKKFQKKF